MSIWLTYKTLQTNALYEFGDIVVTATILTLPTGDPLKLRLDISDGSLLDVTYRSAVAIPIIGNDG